MIWSRPTDSLYWASFEVKAEQWNFVKMSVKYNAPWIEVNPLVTLRGQFFYFFEIASAERLQEFGLSPVYQVLENGKMIDLHQPLYFADILESDKVAYTNTFRNIKFVHFYKHMHK